VQGSVGVGVALKDKLKQTAYKADSTCSSDNLDSKIGHGMFVLMANGYKINHLDAKENQSLDNTFTFKAADELIVHLDDK
jgi:hypothetical protein